MGSLLNSPSVQPNFFNRGVFLDVEGPTCRKVSLMKLGGGGGGGVEVWVFILLLPKEFSPNLQSCFLIIN